MNILTAIFDCSAPDLESCPDESLPEFAFIGRSNVGKSSLLNMLAGQQGLARVSATPGFTKLINIFTMNDCWRLVDLPGYGYARVARKDSSKFNQAVADYLQHRPNLCCVFALIDSSLSPQKLDLEFVEWLARNSIPFVLVFTKIDTVKPAKRQANIDAFTDRISEWFVKLPAVFSSSSVTRQGKTRLLGMIDETLSAIKVESVKADQPSRRSGASGRKLRARDAKKRRPDITRPW